MVTDINESNFDETIKNGGITIVDFWAEWCGPCRMYGPILEDFASSADNVTVVKVNIDENPNIAMKHGIRSIPTTIIFKDGQLITKVGGVIQKNKLNEFVENLR